MLTSFGKLSRKLRIDHGELLRDMAEKLGITPAYLSAVETGKRNVPHKWPKILSEKYSLTAEDYKCFIEAAKNSQLQMRMNLKEFKQEDKDLALAFAREFEELNENDKEQIITILSRKRK